MKKYSTLVLSALSALALGGCAGTSAITTSTEGDGVYYSSKDKTELTPEAQLAQEVMNARYNQRQTSNGYAVTSDANPEYVGDGTIQGVNGTTTEYYDNDYGYSSRMRRFNNSTYSGLGYSSLAYTDPFWYGGYSPYGYGSLYSPIYSPYYAPGLSIGIGLGYGSLYRPYGLGYGSLGYGGLYNPYYGGYGLGYGGYPYYGNSYGYGNGYYGDTYGRRSYPRGDRSAAALSAAPNANGVRSSRMSSNAGTYNNGAGNATYNNSIPNFGGRGRGRVVNSGTVQSVQQQQNAQGIPADQPRARRWNSGGQAAYNNQGNVVQPRRNRLYNGNAQQQQQQQQQQVYRQPTRSYEQPTRSFSQPSRSSFGGSSSGGGSVGGSGGGRGRVR